MISNLRLSWYLFWLHETVAHDTLTHNSEPIGEKGGTSSPLNDAHKGPKVCWETRHCCWPWLDHLLKATSNRIIHVPSIWDMTMRSLCSGLRGHQILIQWITFGMWCSGRFASKKRSQQICSNCVMPPFNMAQNVWRRDWSMLRRKKSKFWRQKGSNPLLGRYLIQWPVSKYIYIYAVLYVTHMLSSALFFF